ncbi:hypothetical protein AGMMS50276_24370 [Synergistales bacterium]|nr:hypothetical protein AGMMS50276_24370 [Synergistales bacterium]
MTKILSKIFALGCGLLLLITPPACAFSMSDVLDWIPFMGNSSGEASGDRSAGDKDVQVAATDSSFGLPSFIQSSWGNISSLLGEGSALIERRESLPDHAYFGEDKESNAKKLNSIRDEMMEILLQGDAVTFYKEIKVIRAKVPALQIERDALRNRLISASDSSWLPWEKTSGKINERLNLINKDIADSQARELVLRGEIAAALRDMGIGLDDAQIDTLLASSMDDDLIQNAAVFTNVKKIVEKLGELSANSSDSISVTLRYAGMYLALNDLLIYTQKELVRKIDSNYKPRVNTISREAVALREEAIKGSADKKFTNSQRAAFDANARANATTMSAAVVYMKFLDSQRQNSIRSLENLERNFVLAANTHKTVKNASDLQDVIRSGLALFDSLQSLAMPDIQPFENEAIKREFEEISKRLKDS